MHVKLLSKLFNRPARRVAFPTAIAALILSSSQRSTAQSAPAQTSAEQTAPAQTGSNYSHFVGLTDFSSFNRTEETNGDVVLLSPPIVPGMPWNELIVSWNANAPSNTYMKIEASATSGSHQTRYYTMGLWSLEDKAHSRGSLRGPRDADGTVNTDTLVLTAPAEATQLRLTLCGTNDTRPTLKFLGASFANSAVPRITRPPNHAAWGKIIATPEHTQFGYPNARG